MLWSGCCPSFCCLLHGYLPEEFLFKYISKLDGSPSRSGHHDLIGAGMKGIRPGKSYLSPLRCLALPDRISLRTR